MQNQRMVTGEIFSDMNLTEHFTMLLEDKQGKVTKSAEKFGVAPELAKHALDIDPTPNGEYLPWIVLKIARKSLRAPEDNEKVFLYLTKFHKLKKDKDFMGSRDINRYKTPADLFGAIKYYDEVKKKAEELTPKEKDGVLHMETVMDYSLYLVTDSGAGAKLFKNTEWCVRDPAVFEGYNPPEFYFFTRSKKPNMLYHPRTEQIMDVGDNPVDIADAHDIMSLFSVDIPLTEELDDFAFEYALKSVSRGQEDPEIFTKSAEWAYRYSSFGLHMGPDPDQQTFPDGEAIIATDAKYAYLYAFNVLHYKFPEGETAIAKSPEYAYLYAYGVLNKRFPAGEKAIATSSEYSYLYAFNVLPRDKNRKLTNGFPAGEDAIAHDPSNSCGYAEKIIKRPFPKGEKAIATNSHSSIRYAQRVLKGPFPASEPRISCSPTASKSYLEILASMGKEPANPDLFAHL